MYFPGLLGLPAELLLLVAEFLDAESSINSLNRTSRTLYTCLNKYLYQHNAKTSESSALVWAAREGNTVTASLSISMGGDVNSKDIAGCTPLSIALSKGHMAVVRVLLDTGQVDVNSQNNSGRTPLSFAILGGYTAVVEVLLGAEHVDLSLTDIGGRTPLCHAASLGDDKLVKRLLDTGQVDVNSKDNGRRTPLSIAVLGGHMAVLEVLLDTEQVDINSVDINDRTPLCNAVSRDDHQMVKRLLATGQAHASLKSALSTARWYGCGEAMMLLLENKQDLAP